MEQATSGWRRTVNLLAIVFIAFLLLPSLIVVPMSFGNSDQIIFPPKGFSVRMFEKYFSDSGWIAATLLSLRVAIWTTVLSVCLGVPAAYALVRGRFPGRRVLALFLLTPIMVPSVVLALAFYVFYFRIDLTQGELRLVLAHCVATLPFIIVTAAAGIQGTDPNIERAAMVMGAGRLYVFRTVTVPLVMPSIIAGALFTFLISFDEIIISLFVARAGDTTLPVKMFSSLVFEVSPVLAAISTMLTFLSAAICIVIALVQKGEDPK
ncbi:MAG: ABC transporter permease [Rhodobacteraceae bacterium]|jgi:putative spermidine/putrescine transport system permease protein|nr:ABC transporter permease [Paracoccaceae bacterium]